MNATVKQVLWTVLALFILGFLVNIILVFTTDQAEVAKFNQSLKDCRGLVRPISFFGWVVKKERPEDGSRVYSELTIKVKSFEGDSVNCYCFSLKPDYLRIKVEHRNQPLYPNKLVPGYFVGKGSDSDSLVFYNKENIEVKRILFCE